MDIIEYYNSHTESEWTRLERHPVEYYITLRHLDKFLFPNCKIADIGGGPGRYSINLSLAGYSVTLADISSNNIEYAKLLSKKYGCKIDNFYTTSADKLSMIQDDCFDVVLCLGPMYHLKNDIDRNKVVRECQRILHKGGVFVVSFLTPWAHAFSILKNNPDLIVKQKSIFIDLIENGIRNSSETLDFPGGWNPKPEAIEQYMSDFGFEKAIIAAAEGLLGRQVDSLVGNISNETKNAWFDYLFFLSTEQSIIGACEHVLYYGRKIS